MLLIWSNLQATRYQARQNFRQQSAGNVWFSHTNAIETVEFY